MCFGKCLDNYTTNLHKHNPVEAPPKPSKLCRVSLQHNLGRSSTDNRCLIAIPKNGVNDSDGEPVESVSQKLPSEDENAIPYSEPMDLDDPVSSGSATQSELPSETESIAQNLPKDKGTSEDDSDAETAESVNQRFPSED